MMAMGIVDKAWPLSPRDLLVPPWSVAPYLEWEKQRMTVYAAQIDRMDQGIGPDLGGNYEEYRDPTTRAASCPPGRLQDPRLSILTDIAI